MNEVDLENFNLSLSRDILFYFISYLKSITFFKRYIYNMCSYTFDPFQSYS